MLESDAPQPIKDRIYIPQEHSRKINESEEAHDDGGGNFSFIFHQKGGKNPEEGEEGKEEQTSTDIGDAVEVHLSSKPAPEKEGGESAGTNTPEIPAASQKTNPEDDDGDGHEKKHINITV